MKAIRGATTVETDSAEEIRESVKELLYEIKRLNKLDEEEIICILFSNTPDIRSYYPAKAAREAGFCACPLFSSAEPVIDGALSKCIRVMIFTEKDEKPVHVYLRGAKGLRKDISHIFNIALDGPAGSGKSTIAKIIARKLNILCVDTGAMYRACALQCLNKNIDTDDEAAVCREIEGIELEIINENCGQRTLLGGKDVTEEIRRPEISMAASKVSAYGRVREKMVDLQRQTAQKTSCILDGRDIGTNVLPDAGFKFFLTASPEIRAERRYKQDKEKGYDSDYDKILQDIKIRDEQDKNRKIAPLKPAGDAVIVDSSHMSIEEVSQFIINKIQEKI